MAVLSFGSRLSPSLKYLFHNFSLSIVQNVAAQNGAEWLNRKGPETNVMQKKG